MIGGSTAAAELASIERWRDVAPLVTTAERYHRVERARTLMAAENADALIVGAGSSLFYFTGVAWGMIERLLAMVLTIHGKPVVICPAFEAGSLDAILDVECDVRYWQEHESPSKLIAAVLKERGCDRLAVDPQIPFGMIEPLRRAAPSAALASGAMIIDGCRSVKSNAELAILRQAKHMTLEVHRRAARILKPGMRANTVRTFIDQAHKAIGAAGSSFCIVQFGASTAFPHGLPTDDILADGDMVLIDTGCAIQGYNSDITRSYVFGASNDEQRRVWEIERTAQAAAFAAVRPGIACEEVDRAARSVLEKHGLGPLYQLPGLPHRTGHGVGLSVHEGPYLVRGDRTPMAVGMCFSNEPMIVLPDKFGVRLEDHLHVTEEGAEWFTEPYRAIDQPFQ